MDIANRREPLILFVGDIVFFYAALWLTLFVRELHIPDVSYVMLHITPFSFLFAAWVLVFFIIGLYEKYTVFLKSKLPQRIFNAQFINVVIAAIFFFLVPFFAIAPKTNLVIYLVVSSILITAWRLYLYPFIDIGKRQKALLISGGKECVELHDEINNNSRYSIHFSDMVNVDKIEGNALADRIFTALRDAEVSVVVVNTAHRKIGAILPHLYKPIYSNVRFIDANELYEDIFERIPLSVLDGNEFFERLPHVSKAAYDTAKRVLDIVVASLIGVVVIPFFPIIAFLIKLEDEGDVFISQERIGERNTSIVLYKFRSMQRSDAGEWVGSGTNTITRIGSIIRKLRIDELPQLWNVIRGDISLVGPRPDIVGLYDQLVDAIPFYNMRYAVKPGLTGWAQLKQQYEDGNISPQSVAETRVRLQYDLYYIKNRSFLLDFLILVRTAKIILLRPGA